MDVPKQNGQYEYLWSHQIGCLLTSVRTHSGLSGQRHLREGWCLLQESLGWLQALGAEVGTCRD